MQNISIIIPIYNEEEILEKQISLIRSKINALGTSPNYELILVENGSTDNTYQIAKKLERKIKKIKLLKINYPSYGEAFKEGIKKSKFDIIVQFDIDFWNIEFLKKSLDLISSGYDVVIGSKNLAQSNDKRPFVRKILSKIIEIFIRLYFHIDLTDTHGIKTVRKIKIIHLIDKINIPNHFFDSELFIRCYYLGYKFKELPIEIKEIRKTRFSYRVRIIEVFKELILLIKLKPYLSK